MKKVLLIFLTIGTFILNAEVCKTKNLKHKDEVNRAQKCLERSIRGTISTVKEYQKYSSHIKRLLEEYTEKMIECKKYELKGKYRKYRECKSDLEIKSKKLRRDEEEARFLDKRYEALKEQINRLESELDLLEMDYNSW